MGGPREAADSELKAADSEWLSRCRCGALPQLHKCTTAILHFAELGGVRTFNGGTQAAHAHAGNEILHHAMLTVCHAHCTRYATHSLSFAGACTAADTLVTAVTTILPAGQSGGLQPIGNGQ